MFIPLEIEQQIEAYRQERNTLRTAGSLGDVMTLFIKYQDGFFKADLLRREPNTVTGNDQWELHNVSWKRLEPSRAIHEPVYPPR